MIMTLKIIIGSVQSECRRPQFILGSGRSDREGIGYPLQYSWASLVTQLVKNQPAMWETWVWSLGWEDSPEEGTGCLLQYSGLENSMDCIVHGVVESQTWQPLSLSLSKPSWPFSGAYIKSKLPWLPVLFLMGQMTTEGPQLMPHSFMHLTIICANAKPSIKLHTEEDTCFEGTACQQ